MIDDQAQRFAQRMIETWPTGPRRTVWHDIALKLHDADAARIAYADLERTATHISTAQFHQAYASAARKTITPERGGTCGDCDATGWVTNPHHHSRDCKQTEPCHCHGITPCRCTRGQQMNDTQRRITDANRR